MLDIGLIGCGRAAEHLYVPALRHVPEARIVAVADPNAERRDLIAGAIGGGCRGFDTVEAMLGAGDVRALIIASPPQFHVDAAKRALEADVSVLVEKPLAPSMKGIDGLRAVASRSRGVFMMGFNRRFWRPVREVREAIRGRHRLGVARATLVMTTNAAGWDAVSGLPDPLDDLAVHQIDLLRFVFGERVAAVTAERAGEREVRLCVELEENVVAQLVAAHTDESQETIDLRCGADRYRIMVGSELVTPPVGPKRKLRDLTARVRRRLSGQPTSHRLTHAEQLRAFVGHVEQGTTPECGIEDGIAAIRAVEAARESMAADGRRIALDRAASSTAA